MALIEAATPQVIDYGAGAVMPPHEHAAPSLNLVVHGGFVERIGRTPQRDYGRGYIAYLPAAMSHTQAFGSLGARQILIRPEPEWIEFLTDSKVILDAAPHAQGRVFEGLGDRLLQEVARTDAFSALTCRGLILEAVAALGRGACKQIVHGPTPAWLLRARAYIHEHALQPITLGEIARAAGRHEIHLAREFRRRYGATIGDCLRRLRIEHAAGLLRTTQMSLSEIALDSGFSSHAHLCREFKARLGLTPSAYRTQVAGGATPGPDSDTPDL